MSHDFLYLSLSLLLHMILVLTMYELLGMMHLIDMVQATQYLSHHPNQLHNKSHCFQDLLLILGS